MKSLLTHKERRLISQVVIDCETGHHLLYKRSDEYKAMFKEVIDAIHATSQTDRQREISEYVKACTNPADLDKYNSDYEIQPEPLSYQVGGQHYAKMLYQPITFIIKLHLSFSQGCIVKYISRYRYKNGLEDLKKAVHYCQLGDELKDRSIFVKMLLLINRKFVKREITKYIKCNGLEGYAGFCIEHTIFGNFKEAESDIRSLIAVEYTV